MAHRVYLGRIDISSSGQLDLRKSTGRATVTDVVKYLFSYGIIADEVLMQGSEPLKSTVVFQAYQQLQEAFIRNEEPDSNIPIFSFVLSNEADSYSDYITKRLDFLRGKGASNAEKVAYVNNNAVGTSKIIDADLAFTNYVRRKKSVSEKYRQLLTDKLNCGDYRLHGLTEGVVRNALNVISGEDVIQTFSLLKGISSSDAQQKNRLYSMARQQYRLANAFGVDAKNDDDVHIYEWKNVCSFIYSMGLDSFVARDELRTSRNLFKIRKLKSLKELKNYYFETQSQEDIGVLLKEFGRFGINSSLFNVAQQSPGIAISMILKFLKQEQIGFNLINEGAEIIFKKLMGDFLDDHLGKRYLNLITQLNILRSELKYIKNSNG